MKKTVALLLLCASAQISAQTILIDFGKDTLTTSGNWNNFADDTDFRFGTTELEMLTDMVDSTGTGTTVDLVYIGKSTANSNNTAAGIGGADYNVATSIGQPQSATRDTMFLNLGSGTTWADFELRDLTPNASYDLTFYAGIGDTRENTLWTIGGTTVSLNPTNNDDTTVTISGAQADVDGVLAIRWASTGANDAAHWSTLEIVSVPEPAAFALLAGAAGMLLAFNRRPARR